VQQCSILYIDGGPGGNPHAEALRALGFSVDVVDDLPSTEAAFRSYHVVVIRVTSGCHLPALGTRLRAKPRFGRRVLIALVPETCSARERRDATASGFDVALDAGCQPRDLAVHILRQLRRFPEYRCVLRAPQGRRKAA